MLRLWAILAVVCFGSVCHAQSRYGMNQALPFQPMSPYGFSQPVRPYYGTMQTPNGFGSFNVNPIANTPTYGSGNITINDGQRFRFYNYNRIGNQTWIYGY